MPPAWRENSVKGHVKGRIISVKSYLKEYGGIQAGPDISAHQNSIRNIIRALKGLIYKNLQNTAEGGGYRPIVPIAVICCP